MSSSATTDAVAWQPWGADAFATAQQLDRPILLSINAVWCYWCLEMHDGAYSDPDVARFINEHFVAIHVDTDHRPDINARYNVGGWPTTSFLNPHGGFIAGATYLPADQFLAMLDEVRRAYAERKRELYDQGNDIQRQRREHAARVSAGQEPDAPWWTASPAASPEPTIPSTADSARNPNSRRRRCCGSCSIAIASPVNRSSA